MKVSIVSRQEKAKMCWEAPAIRVLALLRKPVLREGLGCFCKALPGLAGLGLPAFPGTFQWQRFLDFFWVARNSEPLQPPLEALGIHPGKTIWASETSFGPEKNSR